MVEMRYFRTVGLTWVLLTGAASTLYAAPLYYYNGTSRQVITPVDTPSTIATRSAVAPAAVTPLFREGDSPAGRLMGLPGGIIVQFHPHWSVTQIAQWLTAHGLPLGERLEIQGHWYSIPTPAGMIALETANQLHESGDVISAAPNWWKAMATR
jgi:hypothetical protein